MTDDLKHLTDEERRDLRSLDACPDPTCQACHNTRRLLRTINAERAAHEETRGREAGWKVACESQARKTDEQRARAERAEGEVVAINTEEHAAHERHQAEADSLRARVAQLEGALRAVRDTNDPDGAEHYRIASAALATPAPEVARDDD
ncbi:MAG: hypothetical protein VW547_02040 [Alphaproteobacteria bacterium]